MFIFLNSDGTIAKTIGSRVFKKSNVQSIALFAPFSKESTVLINFVKPDGVVYNAIARWQDFVVAEGLNLWTCNVNSNITELAGRVDVAIEIRSTLETGTEITTSAMTYITVEESVGSIEDIEPIDEYLDLANYAVEKANDATIYADAKSKEVQKLIDDYIKAGDTNLEVVEARDNFNTLNERLDNINNGVQTKTSLIESKIHEIMINNKLKSREQLTINQNTKKVLLIKSGSDTPTVKEKLAYGACKRILLHARIPFDEAPITNSPIVNNATNYSLILICFATTEIGLQPTYFDGSLGVPVIVAAGGFNWQAYASTHVSSLSDGNYLFKLPNGGDFYSPKDERYNIATLELTNVERVIYDPLDSTKAFVWIVNGANNKTLFCSNYNGLLIGPWILYYIKLWGGYECSELPFCIDLDDANQVTVGNIAEVNGLQNLYNWAKSVNAVITAGIKTDQLDSAFSKDPNGLPTEQTKFLQEHQDVFIPIIHDHNYFYQGGKNGVKTVVELKQAFTDRLKYARKYGFAIPNDMWKYFFQPLNHYTDNSIAFWKEIGIVAARDAGNGDGVYASDGLTVIPEEIREQLAEPHIMWVNANQFVPSSANNLSQALTTYNMTLEEWKGLVYQKWINNSFGGFSSSSYKDYSRVHEPSLSVIYAHGNNCSGDNPYLIGLQLGDNLRQSFPGTIYYTHPSAVINRSLITKLLGRY